jgi:DNA-binding transcriptional MerR regulator
MRPQEKAIIEAVSKGAVKLEAPFLTHAELVELVGKVSEELGGDPKMLNRNTIQAWVRDGIFGPSDGGRKIRNRLYSGSDVIRLAAIFHATHVGIRIDAAVQFADILQGQFDLHFERWAEPSGVAPIFDPRDYVVAFTSKGAWKFYEPARDATPESLRQLVFLEMKRAGLCVILNSRMIVALSIGLTMERYRQKARDLADKFSSELERRRRDA